MRLENINQGSSDWLALRKTKVTGTDVATILGLNPYKTRDKLLKQKVGALESDPDNDSMRQGREMEPFARVVYEELTSNFVINPCYQHDTYEWAMCSPDGITYDERTLLEIKCSQKLLDTALSGEIPEMYKAQCWWGMWITGAKKCDYFAYYEGKHALIALEQNQDFIDKALPRAKEFYDAMLASDAEELKAQLRTDEEWKKLAAEYLYNKSAARLHEECAERSRMDLIKMGGGRECFGAGLKLIRTMPKGGVCYSNIPELLGVDLDKYRKPAKEVWTIREMSDE